MGVPNGHVNETRVVAIEFEGQDFFGTNPTEFNSGLAFDNCKTFCFAGMEVVAAGDARHCGTEAYLSSAVEFYGFDEAAPVIGVELQVEREKVFLVEIAKERVPEITFEWSIKVGYFAIFKVVGFVCF